MRTSRSLMPNGAASRIRLPSQIAWGRGATTSPNKVTSMELAPSFSPRASRATRGETGSVPDVAIGLPLEVIHKRRLIESNCITTIRCS
ncbi:hypothetical protein D9M72_523420 [compost metagenome]